MTLTSYVLIGRILSFDSFFATVEFETNPPGNGGPAIAVLPITAIPCKVAIDKKVYIVKYETQKTPTISCEKDS